MIDLTNTRVGRQASPRDWTSVVVRPEMPLRDAIARIDASGLQVALAIDEAGRLAGVVSDGDVRRAVLRGVDLSRPTSEVMNRAPRVASADTPAAQLLTLMRRESIRQVPLLDADGRVSGLATLEGLLGAQRPNWVVIMAGGAGRRLLPLTRATPKPALRVGDKSVLEITLEQLQTQGFQQVFMAVNYLADTIVDTFGDGRRWGVDIAYLREEQYLGTCGALSLLPETPRDPVLVINGDLLTRMRFDGLLDFHADHGAEATMAVREYDIQIPFGVVDVDGAALLKIEEKPVQRLFVNAGIYAVSPGCLAEIPARTSFDMPALFQRLIDAGRPTAAYPLREYWIDIGRIEEYERAQREWEASEMAP